MSHPTGRGEEARELHHISAVELAWLVLHALEDHSLECHSLQAHSLELHSLEVRSREVHSLEVHEYRKALVLELGLGEAFVLELRGLAHVAL